MLTYTIHSVSPSARAAAVTIHGGQGECQGLRGHPGELDRGNAVRLISSSFAGKQFDLPAPHRAIPTHELETPFRKSVTARRPSTSAWVTNRAARMMPSGGSRIAEDLRLARGVKVSP